MAATLKVWASTEKVDNNTGGTATFGWDNPQGQLVGTLALQNGSRARSTSMLPVLTASQRV